LTISLITRVDRRGEAKPLPILSHNLHTNLSQCFEKSTSCLEHKHPYEYFSAKELFDWLDPFVLGLPRRAEALAPTMSLRALAQVGCEKVAAGAT
jgi:hypothetical protein